MTQAAITSKDVGEPKPYPEFLGVVLRLNLAQVALERIWHVERPCHPDWSVHQIAEAIGIKPRD